MVAFAAAFSAAKGIAGLLGSSSQAKAEAERAIYQSELAQRAQAQQSRQAAVDSQFASYMYQQQEGQNEYFKGIFEDQNAMELDLQSYLQQGDMANARRLETEIANVKQRQTMADTAAQQSRIFELERLASDDQLSEQERSYALSQLDRERTISRNEKATELDRVSSAENTKTQEYQSRLDRLNENRAMRGQERQREVDIQDTVLSGATQFRNNMRNLVNGMGTLQAPELYGPDEIERESKSNYEMLKKGVDRDITNMMSKKEADMIRTGMDAGGASNAMRAEIMARMVPALAEASVAADTQAANFVGSKNSTLKDRFAALRAAQGANLENEVQAGMAGLDLINGVRQAPSGVYDADVGSASDSNLVRLMSSEQGVTGPINVNSRIRNINSPGMSIADYIQGPGSNVSYSTAKGYASDKPSLPEYDFNAFFDRASTNNNNAARTAAYSANDWYDRASKSAGNFGSSITDFLTEAGGGQRRTPNQNPPPTEAGGNEGWFGDIFGDIFGGPKAPGVGNLSEYDADMRKLFGAE